MFNTYTYTKDCNSSLIQIFRIVLYKCKRNTAKLGKNHYFSLSLIISAHLFNTKKMRNREVSSVKKELLLETEKLLTFSYLLKQ